MWKIICNRNQNAHGNGAHAAVKKVPFGQRAKGCKPQRNDYKRDATKKHKNISGFY